MTSGMYEGAIQDLIDALGRLPGIGPKSAQRIAFHILQSENETAHALIDAIRTVKERVKFCVQCGNVSEEDECRICRDPRRDPTQICVGSRRGSRQIRHSSSSETFPHCTQNFTRSLTVRIASMSA